MATGQREGSLEAPTRHPIGQNEPDFYDETAIFDELERVCRQADGLLIVDLREVMTVDGFGVLLLNELAARGARLIGASPYVKLLLEAQTT